MSITVGQRSQRRVKRRSTGFVLLEFRAIGREGMYCGEGTFP